jgi:hypothetical protein
LHGVLMTVPSPAQVGHGATLTNWPKNERWARRTSPLPWHVVHVTGLEPGSAPEPSHRSQPSSSLAGICFSTPVATSASVSGTPTFTSDPCAAPALPPGRAEQVAEVGEPAAPAARRSSA